MKKKNLLLLGVIAVLVIFAAAKSLGRPTSSTAAEGGRGTALFEDLKGRVNEVAKVTLQAEGSSLTVHKHDGSWTVSERADYPAKFDRVKQIIVSMSELIIEEPKTKKPERWSQLGVEDPTSEGAESTRIVLEDAAGQVIADLVVGKALARSGGDPAVYVRKASEDQAFLCTGRFDLAVDPMQWIERRVLSAQSREITSVTIEHADGESFTIEASQPNGVDFRLTSIPTGREAKPRGGDPIASALASVYLDDVKPVSAIDFSAAPILTGTWKKADGEIVQATTATFEDKVWIRFAFSYEAPAESPEGEDATDLAVAVQGRIDESNLTISPWAFAIPSYKSDGIAKRLEDLLVTVDMGPELPGDAAPEAGEAPMIDPAELERLIKQATGDGNG